METFPLLSMRFDEKGLSGARHAVSRRARQQGLTGERLGDFLVAVNECVVNAVEHGGGHGSIRLWRSDGELLCEVRDAGPGIPAHLLAPRPLPSSAAPGGRGIWLMRRLADEVRFATGSGGTVVRMRMRLDEGRGEAATRAERADDRSPA